MSCGGSRQVFLSFRGEDTRKTFTDHLYTALTQAGIHTYIDKQIDRGSAIESELYKAIEQSMMSVIVFSKRYASSKWCLDELVKIMERKRDFGQLVLPVFYDVDPSQVRHQIGDYGLEKFARKEKVDKVEGWRAALSEVAGLGAMVLKNEADGHESRFIQRIVEEVRGKLNAGVLPVSPYLVGLESRIGPINSWLQDDSAVINTAVIYGMGGIGKSTIARTVFNLNLHQFKGRSFLANVRATCAEPNGVVRLQKQLLSDILRGKTEKIYSPEQGANKIKDAICCKKVLIVLDDVNTKDEICKVLGYLHLARGSKMIITTRLVLKEHVQYRMFKVTKLDYWDSLQLLSWHAFGQKFPDETYLEQSESVVRFCDGIPLALRILGSSLSGETVDIWRIALEKMKEIANGEIQKVLQVTYDSLSVEDQNLFLDIACFFIGKDKDYTTKILDNCGFHTTFGIQNLVNRCLVTISNDNKLMMHQLLRDMGREVVRQESPREPGKRSRLWRHEDSLSVLNDGSGTKRIEGLILNLPTLPKNEGVSDEHQFSKDNYLPTGNYPEDSFSLLNKSIPGLNAAVSEVTVRSDAFARMRKLRLLQLNYVQLTGEYKEFPRNLRLLCWHGFQLNTIPDTFNLENLVVIDMRHSSLQQLCKGTEFLRSLKILDLSYSHMLKRTPDFSKTPKLEILKLKDCISLIEVDKSVADLERLVVLNLKDCKNLSTLPRMGSKKSLQKLILSGCSKLEELPVEMQDMDSLTVLKADGVGACPSRPWPWHYVDWIWRSPRKIPKAINLALVSLPASLRSLNLSNNQICHLPESIKYLTQLESLQLDSCTRLESFPELPPSLKNLYARDCTSLKRIENLPNLLTSLQLEIFGCESLVEVNGLFKLESLSSIRNETINDMGMLDVVYLGKTSTVYMSNSMTQTIRKIPLQGLYECGVFSIFLQGGIVPGSWFCDQTVESDSFSFDLPLNTDKKIRGLNICVVYSTPYKVRYTSGDGHYAKITNKSKGHKWTYSPTFYGIPDKNDGEMVWLSHWRFDEDQLEGGDEVTFSVIMANLDFEVKECGFRVIYDEEPAGEKQSQVKCKRKSQQYLCQDDISEGSMLNRRPRDGSVPICHHRFLSHEYWEPEEVSFYDVNRCFLGTTNELPLLRFSRPRLVGRRCKKIYFKDNSLDYI